MKLKALAECTLEKQRTQKHRSRSLARSLSLSLFFFPEAEFCDYAFIQEKAVIKEDVVFWYQVSSWET